VADAHVIPPLTSQRQTMIEVSSAAAVAWQFTGRDHGTREARERRALRIIAVSFLALAAHVTIDAPLPPALPALAR